MVLFFKVADPIFIIICSLFVVRSPSYDSLYRLSKSCSDKLSLRGAWRRSNLFKTLRDCFASLAMTFKNFYRSIRKFFGSYYKIYSIKGVDGQLTTDN